MKAVCAVLLLFSSLGAGAQYYYKDIVGTKESADLITTYKANKVRSVVLNSFTVNNTPLTDFRMQQEYLPAQNALRTTTTTSYTPTSYLTSYLDAEGRVIRATDSAGSVVNKTIYQYNAAGKLVSMLFTAGDVQAGTRTDEHIWEWDAQGRAARMLRIKNNKDTSMVRFVLDENGRVVEEQETRRYIKEEPYYYYYDETGNITDIVRYNKKAGRLLPEYMFEYSDKAQVIQRYTIPQNSDDYLIWRYAFNDKGLKTKEVVFNKQKEQTGKVEYVYSYQ